MKSKKVIVNIGSSLIFQIITIICGFIIPKLIIKTYGSEVNGLVVSITEFLMYISLFEGGFGQVIKSLLYKPISKKNDDEIKKILKSSQVIFRRISYIFIIYIIFLCIIYPLIINNSFDMLFIVSLIIIISISTFFECYIGITYSIYLKAKMDNYVISIIQIITLIINALLVLLLIHYNFSIQIVKLASSIIFIIRPIFLSIYVNKKYKINLKDVPSNYKIEQKYDGFAQHIAYIVHSNTDIIILTLFSSLNEVSVYSIYFWLLSGIRNIICNTFVNSVDSAFGDMIVRKEKDKLNASFKIYEGFYLTITTIVFICTIILIVPFISIYTKEINDVNYIRPIFAYIMTIAIFIFILRQLYYSLVKVAGHFKQTKKGAIVEASVNIIVSILLVNKYGIIGVAIGTLVAMTIRTIEIVIYTFKNILEKKVVCFIKRFLLILIEIGIVLLINNNINIRINNYSSWIVKALIIFMISSVIVILLNSIIYKDNLIVILKKKNKNSD